MSVADLGVVDMSTIQLAHITRLQFTETHRARVLFLLKHLVTKDAAGATTDNTASWGRRDHSTTLIHQTNRQRHRQAVLNEMDLCSVCNVFPRYCPTHNSSRQRFPNT